MFATRPRFYRLASDLQARGMKRSLALSALAIWAWTLGSPNVGFGQDVSSGKSWPSDRAPQVLKIATWNLEWFFDDFQGNNRSDVAKEQSAPNRAEWDWRVGNFAAAIAKFEPTILAVQEIEDRGVMQNLTKVLKEQFNL